MASTPSIPYSLLPEMIAEEKQTENTRGRSRKQGDRMGRG
jgi:hypothetical protein